MRKTKRAYWVTAVFENTSIRRHIPWAGFVFIDAALEAVYERTLHEVMLLGEDNDKVTITSMTLLGEEQEEVKKK